MRIAVIGPDGTCTERDQDLGFATSASTPKAGTKGDDGLDGGLPAGGTTSPADKAREATPTAAQWVEAARDALVALRATTVASGYPVDSTTEVPNLHFHFDRATGNVVNLLDKAIHVYDTIASVFNDPDRYYQYGVCVNVGAWAEAPIGGYELGLKINFCDAFSGCGLNTRAAMLVHEGSHFCGGGGDGGVGHYARETPLYDGTADGTSTRNYTDLPAEDAVRNACSYACYAIHASTGSDLRYGARDTSL